MKNSVNEALYSVALGKVRNFIELNGFFSYFLQRSQS